jgi:hypothetical protein
MKPFVWFVKIMYWLQVFAAPLILFGFIALIVYTRTQNLRIGIALLAIGFFGGIFLAEFVRRRYGLENFFSSIYGSAPPSNKSKNDLK